jgi:hypothetical protein
MLVSPTNELHVVVGLLACCSARVRQQHMPCHQELRSLDWVIDLEVRWCWERVKGGHHGKVHGEGVVRGRGGGMAADEPSLKLEPGLLFSEDSPLVPVGGRAPCGLRLEAGALAGGWSGWRAAQDGWGEYGGRWNCRGNKGEKGRLSCRSERVITSRLYLTALDTGQSLGACSPRFIRTNQYL